MEDFKKLFPHTKIITGIDLTRPTFVDGSYKYLTVLEGQFYDYAFCIYTQLKTMTCLSSTFIHHICYICDLAVDQIIKSYLEFENGEVIKGIKRLEGFIKKYKECFIVKLGLSYAVKCNNFFYNPNKIENDLLLFRSRKMGSLGPFVKREDMFHIPLEKSEYASSERYSTAGIPCLYLAINSYVAMKEVNSNDEREVYVSSFKPQQDMLNKSIIDLTNIDPLAFISSREKYGINGIHEMKPKDIKKYLNMLPAHFLSIACSIKMINETRPFKREYVIPNLIMYSLRDLRCVGVAYHSCIISQYIHIMDSCFAFPALKENVCDENTTSPLRKLFKLSLGVNWFYFSKKRKEVLAANNRDPKQTSVFLSDKLIGPSSWFQTLYPHEQWASYEENQEYYKTTYFAFDQFLPNTAKFFYCTKKERIKNFDDYAEKNLEYKLKL